MRASSIVACTILSTSLLAGGSLTSVFISFGSAHFLTIEIPKVGLAGWHRLNRVRTRLVPKGNLSRRGHRVAHRVCCRPRCTEAPSRFKGRVARILWRPSGKHDQAAGGVNEGRSLGTRTSRQRVCTGAIGVCPIASRLPSCVRRGSALPASSILISGSQPATVSGG